MDISTTQTYNASPSAVTQALLSSELAAKRAKLARVDDYTHTGDGSKATTVVNVPAERRPRRPTSLPPSR